MSTISKPGQAQVAAIQIPAQHAQPQSIHHLPVPILKRVFSFVPKHELNRERDVCTRFKDIRLNVTALNLKNQPINHAQPQSIHHLPVPILERVFSFIPKHELNKERDVCTHFKDIRLKVTALNLKDQPIRKSLTPLNLKNPSICESATTFNLNDPSIEDDAFIKLLEVNKGAYQHINISGCVSLKAKSLAYIAQLTNVRSLDLTGCNFNDSEILALSDSNLRSLNLSYCPKITGTYFDRFKKIIKLDLTGCRQLISAAFNNIRQASRLQTLILAKSNVTNGNIKDVIKPGQIALKEIDLSYCKNISSEIYNIVVLMKHLKDGQITLNLKGTVVPMRKFRTAPMDPIHYIQHPLRKGADGKTVDDATLIKQINAWKESVKKRITELYQHEDRPKKEPAPGEPSKELNQSGLRGHFQQIQEQLNRLTWSTLEGVNGDVYMAAENVQKELRSAILQVPRKYQYPTTVPIPPLVFPLLTGKELTEL